MAKSVREAGSTRPRDAIGLVNLQPGHARGPSLSNYAGLSFVAPARVPLSLPGWTASIPGGSMAGGARRVAYYTKHPARPLHISRPRRPTTTAYGNDTGAAPRCPRAAASLANLVVPHTARPRCPAARLSGLPYGAVRNVELRFQRRPCRNARRNRTRESTTPLRRTSWASGVQLELVSRLLGSSLDAARTQPSNAARSLVKSSPHRSTPAPSGILRSCCRRLRDDLPTRMNRAVTQAAANGSVEGAFPGSWHLFAPHRLP